jgi:hypothetical protein
MLRDINRFKMKKIFLFCLIFQIVSCQNRDNLKSKKMTSIVDVSKRVYTEDSLTLIELVKNEIAKHKVPYNAKFYDNKTPLLIDTIMYSPKLDKVVFFVIDRVENKKTYPENLTQEEIDELEVLGSLPYKGYHYNSVAYLGKRIGNSFDIYDFSRRYIGKFKNLEELKKRLRQKFFEEYSSDEKGAEYNVGDIRFWDNPNLWNLIERTKKREKQVEEVKKRNPKNIFEGGKRTP